MGQLSNIRTKSSQIRTDELDGGISVEGGSGWHGCCWKVVAADGLEGGERWVGLEGSELLAGCKSDYLGIANFDCVAEGSDKME